MSANSYSQLYQDSREGTSERLVKRDDIYQHIDQDESWKYKSKTDQKKIGEQESEKPKAKEENRENEFKFEFDTQNSVEPSLVVKCYTGSCSRFYHINCLIRSRHRSLFNAQKKDEFKCSLHFCKLCGATSEQSLLMQCLKCPTSFHMKCSKCDPLIQKLSRRHMICGSHVPDNASEESDRKEDAIENHSKYHSSDLVEQENQNDEEVISGSNDKNIFKIKKHKQLEPKPKEKPNDE